MYTKFFPKTSIGRSSEKVDHDLPFYYYVQLGQFDIVWTNVIVFIIAHLLLLQAIYLTLTEWSMTHYYTFVFSK